MTRKATPPNLDTEITRRYDRASRHSYASIRSEHHSLDWDNQPSEYKIYEGLPQVQVKPDWAGVEMPTLDAVKRAVSRTVAAQPSAIPLDALSKILFHSYGLTARKTYPGVTYHLRAAPSAGALYPVEVYLVAHSVDGLAAGVYHFEPGESRLVRLREGDYAEALALSCSQPESVRKAPATFLLSSIFWRSSWKYRARAYRYCLLDSGHVAGNLITVASALGLPSTLIYNFLDGPVNQLLGLGDKREAVLAIVSLSASLPDTGAWEVPEELPRLPEIETRYRPLSRREIPVPLIDEMHSATRLLLPDDLPRTPIAVPRRRPTGRRIELPEVKPSCQPLGRTIQRRRSSNNFSRGAVSLDLFSAMMSTSTRYAPSDLASPLDLSPYLVVNAVNALDSGVYLFSPDPPSLSQRARDSFREEITYLCLEQEPVGNAAMAVFFICDLDHVLSHYGNRGYRVAHIACGIMGELFYLTSRSLGLGCRGIGAFYDEEILRFFGRDPRREQVIYVVAIGVESPSRHLIP